MATDLSREDAYSHRANKPRRQYIDRTHQGVGTIPAWENRWTGKPHEHKREIARRLRQQGAKS